MLDLNKKLSLHKGEYSAKVKSFIQDTTRTKIIWETATGEQINQMISDDQFLENWFRFIAAQHGMDLELVSFEEILQVARTANTNIFVSVEGRYDRVSIAAE